MSRGGRGGARGGGGGGGMKANALPFEIDADLEDVFNRGRVEDKTPDVAKKIFPDFIGMVAPAPITEEERAMVQIERDMDAQRRAGAFWTGSKEQWEEYEAQSGRFTENFDSFNSATSYGRRHLKRSWRPADLTRIKLEKRFFPRELWDVIDKDEEADANGGPVKRQKKLGLAKSVIDKLAKFDEGAENADPGSDEEEEEEAPENDKDKDAEDDDFDRDPGDDFFEDDPDDLDDDYNAEQYFDGGDDDFEEGGGDDYGEDGY